MRYFIQFSYKGSSFFGYQKQPNAVTVQEVVENALSKILREPIEIVGCGRTDTGVHAKNYIAHFDTQSNITELIYKLNAFFKKDIAFYNIKKVKPTAHARFDAVNRTYRYHISLQKDPFNQDICYCIYPKIPSIKLMNQAAEILLKTSDFTSFAKLHTDVKTNICQVTHALWKENNTSMVFTITADRFLRNMVRSIVGTLLMVGFEKITISEFSKIIEKKDRNAAGTSAPAHGLFLEDILYPENIFI